MIFKLEGLILRQILQCFMLVKAKGKWRGACPPGVRSEGKRGGKFDFLALVVKFGCWVRFLPPHFSKCGGWLG